MSNKKYNVKFYSDPSTLIETVSPNLIVDEVSFTSQKNGGLGEWVFKINVPFDDFATHVSFINFMNFVKVYEIDPSNKTGRVIFTGYLTKYIPTLTKDQDLVEVTCLGLASLMSESLWGTQPTFLNSYSSTAPETIAQAIIDDVNTIFGTWISYETSGPNQTIFATSKTISYDFEELTHLEAMEKLLELTGEDWYWHIDGQGNFHFREKSSTADHEFQVGTDIQRLAIDTNIEALKNDITLEYNGGTVNKSDSTSITAYKRRKVKFDDQKITTGTGGLGEDFVDQKIAELKNPKYETVLEINSQYDIESIRAGQTCKVKGVKIGSTILDDNMQIVGFRYTPDVITLDLDEFKSFAREISKL